MRCVLKKNKMIIAVVAVVAAALIITAVVCDSFFSQKEYEDTGFAMGAVIAQKIKAENPEEVAKEIINRIRITENRISWRIEKSEIAKLNKNKNAEISDETKKYLSDTIDVCKKSNGAVDLTVGNLTNAWNIGSENFRIPQKNELEAIIENVDWQKVKTENNFVTIGDNQSIDLGFVGKGIACDEAKAILQKHQAKQGVISVGGSLCLFGNGTFDIGIRNPHGNVNDYMAVLSLEECFVSTSGNYERFSEKGGKKYHHILSTYTGYPVENNLLSVTVVCSSGLLSDALSTACYCLGFEKSLELLEEYNAEAVFIFDDNTVKVTENLKEKIEIKNNEFELWKEN